MADGGCAVCGADLSGFRAATRFCSPTCRKANYRARNQEAILAAQRVRQGSKPRAELDARACITCGGSMKGRAAQARSCSTECHDRAYGRAHREREAELRRVRRASETPSQRERRLAQKRASHQRTYDAERQRAQYLANRDARLAQQRQYRLANREAKRARDRAYYEANRTKWSAAWRARTPAERAQKAAQDRARWARKAADGTLRRSSWKQDNPEQARIAARIYQSRRRAWKRNTTSDDISRRDIEALYRRHEGLCAYCCTAAATDIDHVVPLSRGGKHTIGNLLPACGRCNRSKGAKTLTEWRQSPTCPMKAA